MSPAKNASLSQELKEHATNCEAWWKSVRAERVLWNTRREELSLADQQALPILFVGSNPLAYAVELLDVVVKKVVAVVPLKDPRRELIEQIVLGHDRSLQVHSDQELEVWKCANIALDRLIAARQEHSLTMTALQRMVKMQLEERDAKLKAIQMDPAQVASLANEDTDDLRLKTRKLC